ncbi:hypothetical protein L798_03414 [Zootermopsis nevadensis]|uniref:Uncharacterized protein n=1 Tax=Zootermopsis nevadensis TaxID=136037 RepID=A0A067RMK6_ZOONE|nr:hypothetical protein L798_03414 [Zootermopsis nevadensis]
MKGNECTKGFPKQYSPCTIIVEDGYPIYKRQNNGSTYSAKNGFVATNQDVVPFCPYLVHELNCHINVESVSSITSVKYLFKYAFKGGDLTNYTIIEGDELHYDEITNYQDSRMITAPEAAHRILENEMHRRSHAIIRLPVHLPNEQTVEFGEEATTKTLEKQLPVQQCSLNISN